MSHILLLCSVCARTHTHTHSLQAKLTAYSSNPKLEFYVHGYLLSGQLFYICTRQQGNAHVFSLIDKIINIKVFDAMYFVSGLKKSSLKNQF